MVCLSVCVCIKEGEGGADAANVALLQQTQSMRSDQKYLSWRQMLVLVASLLKLFLPGCPASNLRI